MFNWNKDSGYGMLQAILAQNNISTFGKIFIVMPTTDGNYDKFSKIFGNDPDGVVRMCTTISEAYGYATSNNHDVILLSANAAHAQTSMLTIAKNRLHFVGMGGRVKPNSIGMGARSRVTMGVTTAATDIAILKNTGVGNTFTGIKFDSSNTVNESLYAIADAGEYTIWDNCEFYKSTDLDVSLSAEVLNNADSAQWLNCVFGSSANIVADNCIRPNMLVSATISGAKCRDNFVSHCLFLVKAAGTEAVRIYGANATDVERMLLVENSIFMSNKLGAATPAHAVGFGAAQTEGSVLLKNCTSVDHTVMAQAAVGIYVDGAVATFATSGIAVAS